MDTYVVTPLVCGSGTPACASARSVSDNRVDITLEHGGTGSLWWATKNEWLGLLDVAGLRLEALYGGFAGEPLDDSREYIFVAHR